MEHQRHQPAPVLAQERRQGAARATTSTRAAEVVKAFATVYFELYEKRPNLPHNRTALFHKITQRVAESGLSPEAFFTGMLRWMRKNNIDPIQKLAIFSSERAPMIAKDQFQTLKRRGEISPRRLDQDRNKVLESRDRVVMMAETLGGDPIRAYILVMATLDPLYLALDFVNIKDPYDRWLPLSDYQRRAITEHREHFSEDPRYQAAMFEVLQ